MVPGMTLQCREQASSSSHPRQVYVLFISFTWDPVHSKVDKPWPQSACSNVGGYPGRSMERVLVELKKETSGQCWEHEFLGGDNHAHHKEWIWLERWWRLLWQRSWGPREQEDQVSVDDTMACVADYEMLWGSARGCGGMFAFMLVPDPATSRPSKRTKSWNLHGSPGSLETNIICIFVTGRQRS